MTALNFALFPQQLLITMDTLTLNGETYRPRTYMTKIYPVLHLNGVICGTRMGNFITEWFIRVNGNMLARDMVHLDEFTPKILADMWKEHSEYSSLTATIDHFGYSETDEQFHGFVYRSTSNFSSEKLPYGVGVKPQIQVELPDPITPEFFISLIERQRAEDDALPLKQRVGIGGDIHMLFMTPPANMALIRCHRFSDYDVQYSEMCSFL